MAQVRVADLPTTSNIDPASYVIIERPGIGEGTFKSTVGDLQRAITVTAKVTKVDNVTTIYIDDINGHTEESIVAPRASIRDNGDGTCTIIVQDTSGTTSETIFKDPRIVDPEPTSGSNNLVTSGTVYNVQQQIYNRIEELQSSISMQLNELEEKMHRDIEIVIDRVELLESLVELIYYTRVCDETGQIIITEQGEELMVPVFGTVGDMRADGGEPSDSFIVDGACYASLSEAIQDAASKNGTVKLLSNTSNSGISVAQGSDFTLDLNGHTLNVVGPGAGSSGTETNGMQLLKDSNVTIKNGYIQFDDNRLKIGIQNYSNLTLDNVQLVGGPTIRYVASNNYGNVVFKNGTTITASEGQVAFDCWYGMSSVYDSGVNVSIEDSSVIITGKVEFGKANRASSSNFKEHAYIKCPESMELDVTILNPPCEWNHSENVKVLRYSGI